MGTSGDRDRELDVAIRAARRGAAAILAQRGRHTVSTKSDGSPVTSADLAADEAVRVTLAEEYPGDAILSEEGRDSGERLANPRCWIVDPLDGTRYFVSGSDDFDIFVALAVDGIPVVAVTLQPVTGLMLGASVGQGAWVQRGDAPRRSLVLSPRRPFRVATKSWLGAPGNLGVLHQAARQAGGELEQPSYSLCPRCFDTPGSRVDAIVGLPSGTRLEAWEWDVAPLDLIVREAGGAVTRLDGASLRYNQPVPRFPGGLVVAASPDLHRALVTGLRRAALDAESPGKSTVE